MSKNHNVALTVVVVVAVVAVLFMLYGCKIKCNKTEGYKPGGLASQCVGLNRSPVDFAFKGDYGPQKNPHYQTNPMSKYQPLSQGPVDMYHDERMLDDQFNKFYDWTDPNYAGHGKPILNIWNDERNRTNLTNIGAVPKRNYMDNIYNPSFGPKGILNTEQARTFPDPFFSKMYGGPDFLIHDRIGN